MRKRMRTIPRPGFFMSSIVARRGPSFSITTPTYPSGQSIINSSYGSSRSPSGPSRGMKRPADLELVSLAPHRLHQDAEVQLAAARDGERVGSVRILDPQRHVALQLSIQPLAQLPAGHELAFTPRER